MGRAVLTLSAAVIGSAVSLVPVLGTQRFTQQVHRREQDRVERHRHEDLARARANRLLEERQAVYVRFSAAARTARDALAACMYDIRRAGTLEDTHREELKQRWDAYVAQHAETHMIASNDVLGVVGRVNGALRKIHGLVKGLDMGPRNPGDSVDALRERIGDLWPSLVALREAMRRDLDLPGSPS
ncbi:hypothetical protein OG257_36750 [Streptomyces sp. NBC_00683]|uniref:hypothetical protein n=1 Tax=Streptomyces sp. NBC_00683 TaxID=2903670 RepID=UPI002E338A78|nr:hypothetical protein [Streptomyces sp. NBC_00683]